MTEVADDIYALPKARNAFDSLLMACIDENVNSPRCTYLYRIHLLLELGAEYGSLLDNPPIENTQYMQLERKLKIQKGIIREQTD